ncbi:MAG: hypothetical protein LBJ89_01515 [Holosporales bacterium]|jgi:hypothetical protein|nr:hypothetical protein [Holosporales bacterium]
MHFIVVFFQSLLIFSVAGHAMNPIVDGPGTRQSKASRVAKKKRPGPRPRVKKVVRHTPKDAALTVAKDVPVVANSENGRVSEFDTQLKALKAKRLDLEFQKHALMTEFAQKQTAFAAILPSLTENKPQQSILLAMSSRSMDDFVHSSVMLNYLGAYFVRKNREYSNLRRSIREADVAIKNCDKYEVELIALRNSAIQSNSEQPHKN